MTHLTNPCEEGQEEKGQESPPHLSHSDAPQGKMKQDFVKKKHRGMSMFYRGPKRAVPEFIT